MSALAAFLFRFREYIHTQMESARPPIGVLPSIEPTNNGFEKLQEVLSTALKGVGAIFIVIGVISIATTIKSGEQNPEAITGAAKNIIIGAIFIAIDAVIGFFKG